MEIWKTITNFENYEVSNLGNVRSKRRCGAKGGLIKPFFDRKDNGYYKVHLYVNGKQFQPFLHRLVAQEFLPKVEGKKEINHINGIKIDNNVSNLEWCSRSENIIHAIDMGLRKIRKVQQLKNGVAINTFRSMHQASKLTGIQYATIYWCMAGIYKQAGGYEWKYVD